MITYEREALHLIHIHNVTIQLRVLTEAHADSDIVLLGAYVVGLNTYGLAAALASKS